MPPPRPVKWVGPLVIGATSLLLVAGCLSAGSDEEAPVDSLSQGFASCPAWPPASPSATFCSATCPCAEGQGDCDSEAECADGLVCTSNVGDSYGLPSLYDVCLPPSCPSFDVGSPDARFCTAACPCASGEGDCDSDAQCESGLHCTSNVGDSHGLPSAYDVCLPLSCPSFDVGSPDARFCTAACPCASGEGDCDSDAQCESGLRCTSNVGDSYGLPSAYDVCLPLSCPSFDVNSPSKVFCSVECPCYGGEGDCDSDEQCSPDLWCASDEGATFGLPAKYDVCLDHIPGAEIESILSRWQCNIPECTADDWVGAVIDWPSWAGYHSNGRTGDNSRSVFSFEGDPLYPYMGAWADGCEVTAESGLVLIIEWERGTDVWRETWLDPGESHVISLVFPENGAMIETYELSPGFSVSLQNCQPQPL